MTKNHWQHLKDLPLMEMGEGGHTTGCGPCRLDIATRTPHWRHERTLCDVNCFGLDRERSSQPAKTEDRHDEHVASSNRRTRFRGRAKKILRNGELWHRKTRRNTSPRGSTSTRDSASGNKKVRGRL